MQRCRLFSSMRALRVPLEVYFLVTCEETKKDGRVMTSLNTSGTNCGVSCIKPNTYIYVIPLLIKKCLQKKERLLLALLLLV